MLPPPPSQSQHQHFSQFTPNSILKLNCYICKHGRTTEAIVGHKQGRPNNPNLLVSSQFPKLPYGKENVLIFESLQEVVVRQERGGVWALKEVTLNQTEARSNQLRGKVQQLGVSAGRGEAWEDRSIGKRERKSGYGNFSEENAGNFGEAKGGRRVLAEVDINARDGVFF
ncbi:hypothetical protein LIER_34167 [Lithospermum erythrorhizon]|uniref:Uncharacterized protein n=1 Tax=Lithospermum erythrorhizon TaxID=34254 RepID=A0AAV3RZK5_LITER